MSIDLQGLVVVVTGAGRGNRSRARARARFRGPHAGPADNRTARATIATRSCAASAVLSRRLYGAEVANNFRAAGWEGPPTFT